MPRYQAYNKKIRGKKGQAVLYIYFIIAMIVIITIVGVAAPLGVLFNVKMYTAGESILNKSLVEINQIQDSAVRASINATVNSALAAGQNNIEVNSGIFQYSWIFVIIIAGVIFFINARRVIEVGNSGII